MLDKTTLYAAILLLFFSFVSFVTGIVSERYLLCLLGAVLGFYAFYLKKTRLSCPFCENSIKLSDLLNAVEKPHKCDNCRKNFTVK